MRDEHNTDSRRYFDWVFYASMDLLAAKTLYADERCYPLTAFHCQQCIEKALKGYLLFKRKRLYDGHNLSWLCKQAVAEEPHFQKWLEISARLNRFYIESRYPADIQSEINTELIDMVFETTTDMMEFIAEQIRYNLPK